MSQPRLDSPWLHAAVLACLALPYFINLGASSIWDGSEAFYAETPREMLAGGDWLSPRFNFEPRVNKPPLTYWAVLLAYKVAGVGEFAVRLPGALATVGVLLFSWRCAWRLFGPQAALAAAVVVATTPRIFILEHRLPIDVLLLFFLTGAFFFLTGAVATGRSADWYGFYACAALGFLTKGPVAALIPAGVLLAWAAWAAWRARDGAVGVRLGGMRLWRGALIFLCIALPYYILSYRAHGWAYIAPFFLRDNLGRFASESYGPSRGLFYYVPVWFSDFFPWAFVGVGALLSLRRGLRGRLKDPAFGIPLLWCALVFLLFSASKNKQEYYIAPMYPAAAVLVAGMLEEVGAGARRVGGGWRWLCGFLVFVLLVMASALPFIMDLLMPDVGFALRHGPSLVLLAGAGALAWCGWRGDFRRCFAVLSFSLWALFLSGALIYIPALERFRPVKDFCRTIGERTAAGGAGDVQAGYFRTAFPSMAFYLGRRIFEEDDYGRMRERLRSGGRVFCILDRRDYDRFSQDGLTLHILGRRPLFSIRFKQLLSDEEVRGRELLLVSNLP
jgi:4-amino-4-deoxy-L-arabinose transferase-like glycosyltransferase